MRYIRDFLQKEPVRRGLRTFIQAAAGYVVVNAATLDFSARDAVIGFFVAAIAAGISAAMNMGGENHEDLS
ncbi:MAG: hypothetical protein E7503_08190 [Ruminococcus sp.]|nr:hypothetical protein [Ruminococcus sp.]